MLRRPAARALLALAVLLAASGTGQAQVQSSLNRAGSGARAAGMGEAFVAVSDDGTAATWNPAGLGQLRQPEFSVVYSVSERGLSVSGARSTDGRYAYSGGKVHFPVSSVEFVSAALPFTAEGRPMTVQVGWHRQYQLAGRWTADSHRFRVGETQPLALVSIDEHQEGNIDVFSAAGSIKITSRLSFGASGELWRGDWRGRGSVIEVPGPGGPPAFVTERATHRIRGQTLTLGLLLTYPAWNVGLVHHAGFWSDYRARFDTDSSLFPSESVTYARARFRIPRSIAAGVARRLPGRWTVAASATHDEWTDALLDRIPGGPVAYFDGLPPELSSNRDTITASIGAEHLFVKGGAVVPVRFGFGWEPQGASDPVTRDPVAYHLVAAGAGYNTNRVKIDAAVQYRWGSFRLSRTQDLAEFQAGNPRNVTGLSSSREWRVKVSAIYRLADTDKLKEILRRIFG